MIQEPYSKFTVFMSQQHFQARYIISFITLTKQRLQPHSNKATNYELTKTTYQKRNCLHYKQLLQTCVSIVKKKEKKLNKCPLSCLYYSMQTKSQLSTATINAHPFSTTKHTDNQEKLANFQLPTTTLPKQHIKNTRAARTGNTRQNP